MSGDKSFKWACLAVASIFALVLTWMVNDVRRDVKKFIADTQRDLPEIVANTKKSTSTLAQLSDDIKAVRVVLGLSANGNDKLLVYTGEVLDLIGRDGAGASIYPDPKKATVTSSIASRLIGSGEKVTVETWVANTRTKALWISLFGTTTRDELLDKLCHDKFGVPFVIQFGNQPAVPLKDWVKEHYKGGAAG